MTYSFTVQVSGLDLTGDRYEDALYTAGCDDALVAVVEGTLFLDFNRDAPSFDEAVSSAIRNVQNAGGRVEVVKRLAD